MELLSTNILIFTGLALLMAASAFAAVTTSRMMRAVTYLLFVLFGTAGIYFMLHYTFLGAVQIIVYAGGIVVLFIFAALLIGKGTIDVTHTSKRRYFAGLLTSITGMMTTLYLIVTSGFATDKFTADGVPMKVVGAALMGTDRHSYVLTFEVLSILLLACMVGAIMIARKK
jgi:NADH-quinone oxidoreductase subunit J